MQAEIAALAAGAFRTGVAFRLALVRGGAMGENPPFQEGKRVFPRSLSHGNN